MPALDFGAFMAGFATQAQKIEEESAKIGMELIKEAIDDFREESKDWKSKYNTELKDWEVLGGRIRDMVGSDAKAIAVLRKGKPYASDFAKTAVAVAKAKGFNSPADLVDFGESTLPKNIDVMDWVRSGAPDMSLEAKPVLDKGMFENMKTGVCKRQIYPEGMGRIERTEETYLDLPVGVRKDVIPEATFTDIYSTTEVPGPLGRTDRAAFKREALNVLKTRSSALSGLSFNLDGSPNYENVSAQAAATAEKHAQQIMDAFERMYSDATTLETAPGADDIETLASGLADEFDNFYDVKPLKLSKEENDAEEDSQQQQEQERQSRSNREPAVDYLTPEIENSEEFQRLVNPSDTAPKMSTYERRIKLRDYLISQGVPEMTATSYVLNLIPSNTNQ